MAEPTPRQPLADLAKYALLPLLVLGGIFAGLIGSGVIPLVSSPDRSGVVDALFLGSVGVLITGNDDVELVSEDGRVTVAIAAGSVTSPVLLRYQALNQTGNAVLGKGYPAIGRYFELSVRPEKATDGPVRFQPMLSTTIRVYGNEILKDYDSGLTCPRKLSIDGALNTGDTIRFHYQLGSRPQLIGRRAPSD